MMIEHILQKTFGLERFRTIQKDIIESVLGGKDTLAILATGGGKSLCYQIPGLALGGVTIVVSPLIALMHDQVMRLNKLHIPAVYLSSSKDNTQIEKDLRHIADCRYTFIFVAPERLHNKKFNTAIAALNISLLAIDEAHCISQWGHDFRPEYLEIETFRKKHTIRHCVALTGTATQKVIEDIGQYLNMKNMSIFRSSFDRPNLKYFAYKTKNQNEKIDRIKAFLRYRKGSGIIYCSSRKDVESLGVLLKSWTLSSTIYHAGLASEQRMKAQTDWINGKARIIVATNAFGMGIDKADVRFVIHYTMSATMENYYQEAGRAGRDGAASICVAYYSKEDRVIQEFFINSKFPQLENGTNTNAFAQYKDVLLSRISVTELYFEEGICRRKYILSYFEENYEATYCYGCNTCLDCSIDALPQLLLPDKNYSDLSEKIVKHIVSLFENALSPRGKKDILISFKTYFEDKIKVNTTVEHYLKMLHKLGYIKRSLLFWKFKKVQGNVLKTLPHPDIYISNAVQKEVQNWQLLRQLTKHNYGDFSKSTLFTQDEKQKVLENYILADTLDTVILPADSEIPDHLLQLKSLIDANFSDADICLFMNISQGMLKKWESELVGL